MSLFSLKPMKQGSADNLQEKKPSSLLSQRVISSEPPTATFNPSGVIRDSFDVIYRSTPLHPFLKAASASTLPQRGNQPLVHPDEALVKQHYSPEFDPNNRISSSSKPRFHSYESSYDRQDEGTVFQNNPHILPAAYGLSQFGRNTVQYSPHYFDDSESANRNLMRSAQKSPNSSHHQQLSSSPAATKSHYLRTVIVPESSSILDGMEPPINIPAKRSQRTGGTVLLTMGQAVVEQKRSLLPPPPPTSSQNRVVSEQVNNKNRKRSDQLSTDHFSQLKNTKPQTLQNNENSDSESTFDQHRHARKSIGSSNSKQFKSVLDINNDVASDEDMISNHNKAVGKERKRTSISSSLPEQNHDETVGKPTRSGRISRPVQRLPGILDAVTDPYTFSTPAPPKNTAGNGKRKVEVMADKPAVVKSKENKKNKDVTNNSNINVWDDIDPHSDPLLTPVRKWKKEETVALYNIHSLSDLKNPNFWLDIASGMQRLGYQRTEEECNQKWNEGINLMFERKSKKMTKDKMKIEERCLEKLSHNSTTAVMVGKASNAVKEEANGPPQAKKRQILGKNDRKILMQQISKASRGDDIFDSNEFKLKRLAASPLSTAGMEELPTPPVTHASFPINKKEQGRNNEPLFYRDNVQKFKRIKPQLIASLAPMKPLVTKKKSKGHALDSAGDIRREIDRVVKKSRVDVLGSSEEENENDELDGDEDDDCDYEAELAKQRRIYSHNDGHEAVDQESTSIEHDL